VSTASALARAQDLRDTLVALTPNNFPLVAPRLGFSSRDLQDVQDALNAGMTVMVHEKLLRDPSGNDFLGYIQFDHLTGAGAYIIGELNGAEMAQCLDPRLTGSSLLSNILTGAAFTSVRRAYQNYLNGLGGPGGFVSKALAYIKIIADLGKGLNIFQAALSAIGPSAEPLLGLVLSLSGLSVLKEILSLPFVGNLAAGAYLSTVAWTAYNLAIQFVNRIVVIEAVIAGIEIPPDCLNE
jgi:hypothetical protein